MAETTPGVPGVKPIVLKAARARIQQMSRESGKPINQNPVIKSKSQVSPSFGARPTKY